MSESQPKSPATSVGPLKKLRCIQRSADRHWVGNGFPVRTLFAYPNLGPVLSPFLLLDYAGPMEFAPTSERRGVGEHPHRGFETVTIVYEGEVEHRDSSGGGGRIGPGDVQWMTAASRHRARGVPRPRLRAARRHVRDGAALGEPARAGTRWRRRATRASSSSQIPAVSLPRRRGNACA